MLRPVTTTRPMRRSERQAQTRQLVLDAAERLFRTRGFGPTSIDDIAAEAGYSKGAVYSNFSSKTDLYFAVLEGRYERLSDQLREAVTAAGDLSGQVDAVKAWYRRNLEAESSWARSLPDLASVAQHDADANRRLRALTRSLERTVTELLREQEVRLRVRYALPPERIAAIGIALVGGLAMRHLLDHESTDELFASAIAALLATAG